MAVDPEELSGNCLNAVATLTLAAEDCTEKLKKFEKAATDLTHSPGRSLDKAISNADAAKKKAELAVKAHKSACDDLDKAVKALTSKLPKKADKVWTPDALEQAGAVLDKAAPAVSSGKKDKTNFKKLYDKYLLEITDYEDIAYREW